MQVFKRLVSCVAPEPSDVATKRPYEGLNKNHFICAGILGEGGFGKVMAGTFIKNSEWYAIKEIDKADLLKHKTGVDMLFGEVQAMKRLDHFAIINLQFAFNDKQKCYLVMDLKTGGDLRYFLRKRYLFEEVDVAFYVACLSSALDHMHQHGIIHRDVKPENILLDERGYPYLTDFGVAHVQQENDSTLVCTLASGTRQYLAPEVFTKSHIHGPEMDFWSLGVVAYELLFGRRPFDKHCPIPMINYIEKALLLQRKFDKEKHMRRLSAGTTRSQSPSVWRDSFSSGSFCASHGCNSPSTLDGSSPPRRRRPSIGLRPSSESTTGEKGTAAYCSSVGITRPSSNASSTSDDRILHTVSNSGEERGSVGSSSLEDDKVVVVNNIAYAHSHSGTPPRQSKHQFPSLKPTGVAAVGSPPRPTTVQQRSRSNSALPGIFPMMENFEKMGMEKVTPGEIDLDIEFVESSAEDCDSETMPVRLYQPGDHWLVDDGKLPSSLRVPIPKINPWLGELSEGCLLTLRGLFDIRPSYRLGCRNMDMLKNQLWFHQFGDWDKLQTRNYEPHFQPGKRFMRETMESMGNVIQAHFLGEDDDTVTTEKDIASSLSAEQEEMFADFLYIAPKHSGLFPASHFKPSLPNGNTRSF